MDERVHNVEIEERRRLTLSAVSEVESFNDSEIVLKVKGASLTVKGGGLHVEELSVETGDAIITGASIDSLTYSKIDHGRSKDGFFGRLFK